MNSNNDKKFRLGDKVRTEDRIYVWLPYKKGVTIEYLEGIIVGIDKEDNIKPYCIKPINKRIIYKKSEDTRLFGIHFNPFGYIAEKTKTNHIMNFQKM